MILGEGKKITHFLTKLHLFFEKIFSTASHF